MNKKWIVLAVLLLLITGCTRKSDYIEKSKDLSLRSEDTETIYQEKMFLCTGDKKKFDKIAYSFKDNGTFEELLYIDSKEPYVTPGNYHLHPYLKTKINKEELDVYVFDVFSKDSKEKIYTPFTIYKDELIMLDDEMEPLTEYGCKSITQ